MSKTYVVHIAGDVIVQAEDESAARELVNQKLTSSNRYLNASAGFRVESATEMQVPTN